MFKKHPPTRMVEIAGSSTSLTSHLLPLMACTVAIVCSLIFHLLPLISCSSAAAQTASDTNGYRIAKFSADVTIPLNHRCMGVLPTKSKRVLDPLFAHGFVLLGGAQPIVLVAVDWCEIRNRSYDQWRDTLARVAGTDRQHVLVCSVHQNDGSPADRLKLTRRLYAAMVDAWKHTQRFPIHQAIFRNTEFELDFHPADHLTQANLERVLHDTGQSTENRILAAMELSSRRRLASGQKIDLPCIDFQSAQIVLFPGESFVGYQLMAQRLKPDSFVISIGFGECWPGYIPTDAAFRDRFTDKWL